MHLPKVSVSSVLEMAVRDWLKKSNADAPDDQAQRKLRTAAAVAWEYLQASIPGAERARAL
jgi:hypothetical protein